MNILKRENKVLSAINKNFEPTRIPLTLNDVNELVYKHDPRPIEQKRLNLVIEEYLLGEVFNIPIYSPLVIEVNFKTLNQGDEKCAKEIIYNNFARLLSDNLTEKKREMRKWRANMIIGAFFLAACLVLCQIFSQMEQRPLISFLKESFGIIGWVAIWEPASYLLYGWREDIDKINSEIRLKNAEIIIKN